VMLVVYLFEPARSVLGFARLSTVQIAAVLGYGLILLVVLQLLKPLVNRILQGTGSSRMASV